MLTDIRRGDEDLCEGDGVVGEEEEGEEVFGFGVVVDDTGDVDDEADRLGGRREGGKKRLAVWQTGRREEFVTYQLGDVV